MGEKNSRGGSRKKKKRERKGSAAKNALQKKRAGPEVGNYTGNEKRKNLPVYRESTARQLLKEEGRGRDLPQQEAHPRHQRERGHDDARRRQKILENHLLKGWERAIFVHPYIEIVSTKSMKGYSTQGSDRSHA